MPLQQDNHPKVNAMPIAGDLEYDDDEEMSRHEDLMDTILEEEEQLITAHRMQVGAASVRWPRGCPWVC